MQWDRKREEAYDRSRICALVEAMLNGENHAHTKQVEVDALARLAAFNARPESDKLAAANLINMARKMDLFSKDQLDETIQTLLQRAPRDTEEMVGAVGNAAAATNTITVRDDVRPEPMRVDSSTTTTASSSKALSATTCFPELTITAASTRSSNKFKAKDSPAYDNKIVITADLLFRRIAIAQVEADSSNLFTKHSVEELLGSFYHGKGVYNPQRKYKICLDDKDEGGFLRFVVEECFDDLPPAIVEKIFSSLQKGIRRCLERGEEGLEWLDPPSTKLMKQSTGNISAAANTAPTPRATRDAEGSNKAMISLSSQVKDASKEQSPMPQPKCNVEPKATLNDGSTVATDFSERQSLRLLIELCKRRLGE